MFGDKDELREIQLKELALLKEVKRICKKYRLRYFLCGGTLLGAVRHQGFIPWDDDIDIMMPREDYEQFIRMASEEWQDNIQVEDYYYTNSARPDCITHVVDKKTTIIRTNCMKERRENLCIDIFPLDGMPKSAVGRIIYFYYFRFYHYLFLISCFSSMVNMDKPGRPLWEKAAIKFLSRINMEKWLNSKRLLKKQHSILMKYKYEDSKYIYSGFGTYGKKEILPKKYFHAVSFLRFEDDSYCVPSMYHEELTHYYGDYMVIPKKQKKRQHSYKVAGE